MIRHRIIFGVQHPARLLGEVKPWRAEYIDQLIHAIINIAGSMNDGRRNYYSGGRSNVRMLVLTPITQV